MLKGPYISLIIGSRASTYDNNLQELCEFYIRQHFVDSVYFLQLKLFLKFLQISILLPIFLPAEAGYFFS